MGFDFSAVVAPFRMQPGLRRLEAGTLHLTPNGPGDRALREKLAVLGAFADQALLRAPGFDDAGALRALAAVAEREHPGAFMRQADGAFHATRIGWALGLDGEVEGNGPAEIGACLAGLCPSWRLAGLLCLAFAEDFAVIDGRDGSIPWLAVCLPSGWAPEEKIGRHFAEVHAPVADNAALLAVAEHLVRLVTGGERWERFVWTLTDDPRLHRHPRHAAPSRWDPALEADALGDGAWLRTERQTFLPVAGTSQALFTIRVETASLPVAIESRARADALRAALASMSPAVLAYRGLAPARERLLAWLDTHPSASG